jgi:hypothetical protein
MTSFALEEMALSVKPTKLHFAASPQSVLKNNLEFGVFVKSVLFVEEALRCGFSLCPPDLCATQGIGPG